MFLLIASMLHVLGTDVLFCLAEPSLQHLCLSPVQKLEEDCIFSASEHTLVSIVPSLVFVLQLKLLVCRCWTQAQATMEIRQQQMVKYHYNLPVVRDDCKNLYPPLVRQNFILSDHGLVPAPNSMPCPTVTPCTDPRNLWRNTTHYTVGIITAKQVFICVCIFYVDCML